MNNKQKKAITNIIRAAENPGKYGLRTANTAEQNKAVVKALRTLFDEDEKGEVTDFNVETIESFYGLRESPTIDIL